MPCQLAQGSGEVRAVALVEHREAFGEGHQPVLAGGGPGVDAQDAGEREQAHAVVLAEGDGRQRQGDPEPGTDPRRLFQVHAARPIHEQVDGQVAAFLEDAHEKPPQTPVDVPVDGPQVVPRHVGFEVRELEPEAPVPGCLLRRPTIPGHPARMQAERLQRRQEVGVEQFGKCGRASHGTSVGDGLVPSRC